MKEMQLRMLQAATATQRNYIAQVAFMMNDADTLQLLLQHYAHEFSAEAVQYMRELVSEILCLDAVADAMFSAAAGDALH